MGISENQNLELNTHIKCVNFDLSTEELRKRFSNTAEAYNKIKEFILDNGFEHRQKSAYISKTPLNEYQVDSIAKKLGAKFTWLKDCMQEFDVSNAPEKVSIKETIFNAAQKAQHRESTKKTHKKRRQEKHFCFDFKML